MHREREESENHWLYRGGDWFARGCIGLTVIVVAAGFVAGIFAALAGDTHVVRVGARRVVIELGAGFGGGMNVPYFGLGVAILFGVLSI